MSNGAGYSSRHLEHADYYAEGERVVGHWQGRGAELLDLGGEVNSEDFEALRQALDPQTGEFLRRRRAPTGFIPMEPNNPKEGIFMTSPSRRQNDPVLSASVYRFWSNHGLGERAYDLPQPLLSCA